MAGSRALCRTLGANQALGRLAHRYGTRRLAGPVQRFVPGDTLADALAAAQRLQALGMRHAIDYLGRPARTFDHADANARRYVRVVETLAGAVADRALSVRLTYLGLGLDRATCLDNLRRVLDAARRHDCFVRIDAEASAHVGDTLDMLDQLWQSDYRNVGAVIQARLKRSEHDLERMMALGASVRLVEGEYDEPARVAYRRTRDVQDAFTRLLGRLFREGTSPAVATHDAALIEEARRQAASVGLARDRFEFQMFYGVERELQESLLAQGCRVRVLVPFGPEWFPYFMRRLGDRPADLLSAARSLLAPGEAAVTR